MISTVIIMIIDVQQSCPGIKVDVTRSIQEASLSDLSHILSSSDIVKKRRTMLLLNKSYEVVNINKCIFFHTINIIVILLGFSTRGRSLR